MILRTCTASGSTHLTKSPRIRTSLGSTSELRDSRAALRLLLFRGTRSRRGEGCTSHQPLLIRD